MVTLSTCQSMEFGGRPLRAGDSVVGDTLGPYSRLKFLPTQLIIFQKFDHIFGPKNGGLFPFQQIA